MQLVRYFGWYSNKARWQRAKSERHKKNNKETGIDISEEDTPCRKLSRMQWAALIKRVYEVDPLLCLPTLLRGRDGGEMKLVVNDTALRI